MTNKTSLQTRDALVPSPNRVAIEARAQQYFECFSPDQLTAAPTRKLVVLACMDARLDLFRLLGLAIGDAHILRNAGGRASDDAIRSLIVSAHWLGTREFVVIHHTGCGLHGVSNDTISDQIESTVGIRPSIDFLSFDDIEQSVANDVQKIVDCPLLPPDCTVWGAIYDVHSGELIPVTSTQRLANSNAQAIPIGTDATSRPIS